MNSNIVASFITDLQFDQLPGASIEMVKRCFLDFLGVAVASKGIPAVESGSGLLETFGESGESAIIGCRDKVPLMAAVWANALLGNALELEDGYYPSVGHPASIIFPVTLAISEKEDASTKEFIVASIIGYEVCARSGMLMSRTYRQRALGSGGSGSYGATAAAARLLGLGRKEIEMALGIAGSYMPSVPVHRTIKHEAMTKGGGPWGAVVGVASAFLSHHGFTAAPGTLQDPFCSEEDESARQILQSLGNEYEIVNVYFKRYPSCRWTHAALDAMFFILKEHPVSAQHITNILVETFEEATTLNNYRPSSLEGLQYSIPFLIALAIIKGQLGVKEMLLKYLTDATVQKIADKVEIKLDPTLDEIFPKHRPARVTITTNDGTSFAKEIKEVHGEPGSDFAIAGVKEKFFQLVSERLGKRNAAKLYEMVEQLEEVPSIEPLLELLRG